jgi:argininosuccinate synthase
LTDRIVLGYFGDRASLQALVDRSAAHGGEVVAVAFDLGGTTPLSGLRDEALAAGAIRCHALDVREDFAREVVMPALRANAAVDPRTSIACLADGFVDRSLQTIARLEAAPVHETSVTALPWLTRPRRRPAVEPATASLQFARGVPVELNAVPMTLTEILESVETITGHAAADALHLAYRELEPLSEGVVQLTVQNSRLEVLPRLVTS